MSPPFTPTRAISSGVTKVVKAKTETPVTDDERSDTIVLNFARYYNAWKDSREQNIVPLKYQFESTDVRFTKGRDESDFLKNHLYDRNPKRTLFLSHPPLEKKNRLSGNSLEMENVLIRIQSSESPDSDLILQGNFETKQHGNGWEFMIFRMFFAQHCGGYMGEIKRECRLYTRINTGNIDKYVLLDTDGGDLEHGRVNYSKSIIDSTLIGELSSKYIVLNPKETRERLDDWLEFLNFTEKRSAADRDRFVVVRPKAYNSHYGPEITGLDVSKIILKDNGTVWTEQPVPKFSQCILVRLEHIVGSETDDKNLRKYAERFNAVSRGAPVLTDPAADGKNRGFDPEERKKERELSMLGERVAEPELDAAKKKITAYFSIVPPRDRSAEQFLREVTEYYSTHSQLVLTESDVAAKASVNRQRIGISAARNGTMANPLLAAFLDDPRLLPEPKSEEIGHYFGSGFNGLQKKAINGAVFSRGLYLIQGPPGTGKTQVIAEITAQEVIRGRKVLITSQGNKAVDNAFERLGKYGFIRPVRIMADRRENGYDAEHLVSGFCESSAKSLRERIGLFGNEDTRRAAEKKIEEFREFYVKRYLEASFRVKKETDAVEKLVRDHNARVEETNCRNAENRYRRNRISELETVLGRLSDFEKDDYSRFRKILSDMLPFVPKDIDLDTVLYGKGGFCAGLAAMDAEKISEEQKLLDSYSPGNGSFVAEKFGQPVPVILSNMKNNLAAFGKQLADETEKELSELRAGYTPETKVKGEEGFASKLVEYTQKPDYQTYLEAKERLHGLISELFSLLSVTDRYETVEEAKRIIDREEKNLALFDGSNAAKCIEALGEVAEYLSEEGVSEIGKDRLREELSGYVNVVGATSTSKDSVPDYGKLDIKKMGIDTVIVDEVSKVPFCELMYPLSFGKKIILVGDQKQLPPVYNDNAEENELKAVSKKYADMYTEPLFADLFDKAPDYAKTMLTTQYRMSEEIMGVINRFYNGALIMGCGPEDRLHRIEINGKNGKLLRGNQSVLFVNCNGKESRETGSTSFFNSDEADAVDKLVRLLDGNCMYGPDGKPPGDGSGKMSMGVITPYKDQIGAIRKRFRLDMNDGTPGKLKLKGFRTDGEEKFMIKSVDDFQGDERDVIILSLVRTASSAFISDFRRINVAMSRARRLLIIVGNAETLCNEKVDIDAEHTDVPVYGEIIEDLKNKHCYVEAEELPEANE